MSFYISAPGVPRVHIHPYPKRRRSSHLDVPPGRPVGLPVSSDANDPATVDTPCYADFFREPQSVEQAS
jgi:hypothetical protein